MSDQVQFGSGPGISIRTLLATANTTALRALIGPSVIEVLEGLNPSVAAGEGLGEFAANLIEPEQVLRNRELRDKVIGLLPLAKARELGQRLGVEPDRTIYDSLRHAAANDANREVLRSFFGIVDDPRAPMLRSADLIEAQPAYGLFAHQRRAAMNVRQLLYSEPRKVVLHMPTGSGKTRTSMALIAQHLREFEPTVVWWLAQNAELLDQAADEFEPAWNSLGNRPLKVARFWGQRTPDLLSIRDGIVIAGLAKTHALDQREPDTILKLADRVSLVVIDEAHQAIAPTYASVLSTLYTKRATTSLLGLTATPGRSWSKVEEDQKLSDFFDNQKVTLEVEGYENPVKYLIDEGYLARPTFRTLNSESGLAMSPEDVSELSNSIDVPVTILERLGDDSVRTLRIVSGLEDLATRHQRIIAFAPSVGSARLLASILLSRGHVAFVVTANTPTTDRELIIQKFKSKKSEPMIMCNYGVLTTGFDAPSTSAALIARPTRSLVLYSQMVGRATRGPRAGGNEEAEIVTVTDPGLPGFGGIAEAFKNWEDVWHGGS